MAEALTVLAIHEAGITSEVCQRCAKCCEIDLRIPNTDARYRRFLRGVGLNVSPPISDRKDDCCDQSHEITVHLGPCQHLRTEINDSETLHSCELWDDPRRPQLCQQYNCVSFAKAENLYREDNRYLAAARLALALHRQTFPNLKNGRHHER